MRLIQAVGLAAATTLAPPPAAAEDAPLAGTRPASAAGEPMPVVVELFTSQGCSACPPADALMADLARMEGVIPLSLHVDYWDYIGWPDSFGSPLFSARQEAYARAAGERMLYTPQVIVNGQDRVVGSDAMAVMARLHARAGALTPVALRVSRVDGSLLVEAESSGPVPRLQVQLVRFISSDEVVVTAGENAGRTLSHTNVVTAWDAVGEWSGEERLSLTLPLPGPERAVVLLQEEGMGPIRAAALVD